MVNRIELTFPGKQAVLVCEVLTKSSAQGKSGSNTPSVSSSFLDKDLEEIASKLKPYIGNRKIVIRFTFLDGLFQHPTMALLENSAQDSLKGKKLGTGLLFLTSDLLRSVCLITQLPVAGLFSLTFLKLVQKAPNHRVIFDWLDIAFRTVWSNSEKFRRVQGIGIQVKGRYNISNDRSQRYSLRLGAVSLSNIDVLIDYRYKAYPTKGGRSGLKVWLCYPKFL